MQKKKPDVLSQDMPQEDMPQDTPPGEGQGLSRVAQYTLVVIGLVALALFLWQIVDALLLAFAGVLVAVFLRGCATRLRAHTPLSTPWALSAVGLGLITVLGPLYGSLAHKSPRSSTS